MTDPMLAIRGSEVEILREELAKAQADVARLLERAIAAEQGEAYYRRLYRGVLQAYGTVAKERDAARELAQAVADQAPIWESGPS